MDQQTTLTKTANSPAAKRRRTTLHALIVGGSFFMEVLDSTIISPAVPEIARTFGVGVAAASSGISSYLITVAIFIPASAWLSARLGPRRLFAAAIALFTLASVLCGLSQDLTQFVLARIVQGIVGAMMSPVGRIAVLGRTEKTDMLRIVAYLTWPGLTAFLVAPPLGGILTATWSWRAIFFINIPIGLMGVALVLIFFDRAGGDRTLRFDLPGFLLNGAALGCLMYGLESVSHNEGAAWEIAFILAGAVLAVFALRHAFRHPAPLLPLTPFRILSFRLGALVGGGPFRVSVGATTFLLPVMFQVAYGLGVLEASLLFGYYLFGDLAAKLIANRVVRRFGYRATLIGTSVLIAVTTVAIIACDPTTPRSLLIPLLMVSGAVRSIQFTGMMTVVFADMPPEQIGIASTLNSMMHPIGFGIGVALAATVLALSPYWPGHAAGLTLGDFRAGLALALLLVLVSLPAYWRMPAHAGMQLR